MGVLGVKTRPGGTFDGNLEFKDVGLVAASAAAKVADAAKVIDVGTGEYKAEMILDVSAIEVASNDEIFNICVQVSNSATFASGIQTVSKLELGASEVILGDADSEVGRYKLMFDNEVNGTYYRYARVYTVVAGTIATGIDYAAWAVEIK